MTAATVAADVPLPLLLFRKNRPICLAVSRKIDNFAAQCAKRCDMRTLLVLIVLALSLQLRGADITFVDAGVKAVCVANWDSNGDGELSEEEAAAVTTLGSVFRERTNIGEFPELRYFTSLPAINDSAFYKSSIKGELRVPGNVNTIGDYAFDGCSLLTNVVLEEGVDTIGWHSFSGPIKTLSLPASLRFMYSMAVNPYVNGEPSGTIFIPEGDLYVYAKSKTPAPINEYAFYYVFYAGHLVVPYGCKEAYKAAKGWSYFGEYIEMGDVNGDGRLDIADVTLLIAFIQGREHTETEARIADVNGDGVLDGKDVELLCQYLLGS